VHLLDGAAVRLYRRRSGAALLRREMRLVLGVTAAHQPVGEVEQEWPVEGVEPDQLADHGEGKLSGDVDDEVTRSFACRSIQERLCEFTDSRFQPEHHSWSEALVDPAPKM
jgi:hypothetical protein